MVIMVAHGQGWVDIIFEENRQGVKIPDGPLCLWERRFVLMDEPGRTSLALDIASPYSIADYTDLEQAAKIAGLPLNPPEDYQGDHIEWIPALRLS
jgi:hypothetical protein